MDALPPLHEVGSVFSCCELCTENTRCHWIILAITFVLMTFDMITDWINWIEWYGIGGYDQYFFASAFETIFLCVAAVGSGLWIIEVIVIIKKWINLRRKSQERKTPRGHKNLGARNESKPEDKMRLDWKPELDLRQSEPDIRDDNGCMFEAEEKKLP